MPHSETRLIPLSHPELGEIVLGEESLLLGRETHPFLGCSDKIFKKLSRKHARITTSADSITLSDLGSANGTTVNGQLIATAPQAIVNGDEICFAGEIRFRLKCTRHIDQDRTLFTTAQNGANKAPRDKTMFISSGNSYLAMLCEEDVDPDDAFEKKTPNRWKKRTLILISIGIIVLALSVSYFLWYSQEQKGIKEVSLLGGRPKIEAIARKSPLESNYLII